MSENKINPCAPSFINKIMLTFFCVITLRTFLDSFAYKVTNNQVFLWEQYMHSLLYFSSIFLSFSLLLYFFTKSEFEKILLFLSKVSFIILAVPLVDLLINKTKINSSYVTIVNHDFLLAFFQVANPFGEEGVTKGIYFSAYVTLLLFFIFIFKRTRSAAKSILSVFFGYVIFFSYSVLPNLLIFNQDIQSKSQSSSAYLETLKQSWMTKDFPIGSFFDFSSTLVNVNIAYDLVMARIFWIMIILQVFLIFYLSNRKIWKAFMGNLRLERVVNYSLIASIGILLSQRISGEINLTNPLNLVALICFFLLLAMHAWLAVFINDKEDLEIDKISNPDRPLIKKEFSLEQWSVLQKYIFIILISGTLILNNSAAFLLVLTQCAFYLYSSKTIRLKRHFVYSSLLISFTTIAVAMAGFYLVSPNQSIQAFPLKAILIIGLSYALLSNVKDIKDYAGDKAENIRTIPVVFGLGRSKKIIATLYAIIFMSIPYFLEIPSLMPFAVSASIFSYYLFTKKDFNEKYIFFTKFAYMLVLFLITM